MLSGPGGAEGLTRASRLEAKAGETSDYAFDGGGEPKGAGPSWRQKMIEVRAERLADLLAASTDEGSGLAAQLLPELAEVFELSPEVLAAVKAEGRLVTSLDALKALDAVSSGRVLFTRVASRAVCTRPGDAS